MSFFLRAAINGLSLGFIYALIALGFVIIFKATEVVNFAHGGLLLLGAYVVAVTHARFGFGVALVLGIGAAALAAIVVERLFVRTLRGADVNTLAIMTIGVQIILTTEITRRIGVNELNLGDPWKDRVVKLPAGLSIAETRLAAVVVALVLMTAFFVAFKFSSWGVAMRASAEDGEAAALMGIRRGRVSALAWVVAGSLAAIAGLFLAGFPTPGLDPGVGNTALKAFPAAILGGLDSTGGAVVGGLVIGLAETLTATYQDHLLFLGRGFGDVMPYVVMIAVLLIRPTGLFGTKELARV